MNCQDAQDLLYAYADNELDAVTSRELEAHMQDCPDCKNAFAADRAVKSVIANPALRRPAPNLLREGIQTIAAKSPPQVPSQKLWRIWPIINLAASVLIVAGLAWLYTGIATRPNIAFTDAQDVLDAHLRSMQIDTHLMDVKSTDQHTVKPWFDGKLDFAPPVRDLKDQGFPLIGGRLDYLHGHPVAALIYQRFKHLINVFIYPHDESPDLQTTLNGYTLLRFTTNGMTFWAISDVNPQDLATFTNLLRASPPTAKP